METTPLTENLRREIRVDMRVPIVLIRGRKAVSVETLDVSFRGLFVVVADPPALRSLVRLKITLFDREFEAHAMAVHLGDVGEPEGRTGVGLQFWGLAGPDRKAWDEFVSRLVARRTAPKSQRHPALGEAPAAPLAPRPARSS